MPNAAQARRERARSAEKLGARLLEHLARGAPMEEIAEKENLTRRETEKLLRKQFDGVPVQAVDEFAKLQIRRLEAMIGKLSDMTSEGDMSAVAPLLKVLDRMDRYHGFGKGMAIAPAGPNIFERQRVIDKIDRMAARAALTPTPAP